MNHSSRGSIRGSSRAAVVCAVWMAFAAGSVLVSAAVPRSAECADAVDEQVAEFRRIVDSGDETQVISQIKAFARRRDKKIDAALVSFVRTLKMDIACREGMRVLALHGDAGYLGWVRSKLGDRRMLEEHAELYYAMLDSLPAAGNALKPHLGAIAECVSDSLTTKPDIMKRAVAAYASAGSEKFVIDQLIDWLDKTESGGTSGGGARGGVVIPPPGGSGGGGGGAGAGNAQMAKEQILAALRKLTESDHADAGGWKSWWSANKSSFKPQPARPPEPDWPLVREFTDDIFGFVLRKPNADKGWCFERCDAEGGRARLKFQPGPDVLARVDVVARRKPGCTSATAYAQHLDTQWRKSDFSEFFPGREPASRAVKIGGRDFVVVEAKGVAAGSWKDWDACERRTYLTQEGGADTYLCFEAVVRVGLPEAQRTALWSGIEATAFESAK